MMSNLFGVSVVVVPADSHHSIGRAERQVQIIEKAFTSIDLTVGEAVDYQTEFPMALTAHNTTPNSGNNISPMFAINGRPSMIEKLLQAPIVEENGDSYDVAERGFRNRTMAIRQAQDTIKQYDAQKTIKMRIRKNNQIGADILLRENDLVDLWLAKKKRWQGTYRVLYDGGRSVMIENLGAIFKHPKAWVRLRTRAESVATPLEEQALEGNSRGADTGENEPSSSSGWNDKQDEENTKSTKDAQEKGEVLVRRLKESFSHPLRNHHPATNRHIIKMSWCRRDSMHFLRQKGK